MKNHDRRWQKLFFDLDGTLLDTAADIKDCLEKALATHAFPISEEQRTLPIGPPLDVLLHNLYPTASETERERVIQTFRGLYDTSDYPQTVPYPGISDLLAELALSCDLYIATNKVYLPTQRLVKKFGWGSFFVEVLTPDRFGQPCLSKTELIQRVLKDQEALQNPSVLIGDYASDVLTAHATQLSSVAVTWGYDSLDHLKAAKPDTIVETTDALHSWIRARKRGVQ